MNNQKKEKIQIKDESNDKKYFTIIPNYVLNHSTHWDREVYIQMKKIAGENGTCYISKTKLTKQTGISKRKLDKSIDYLINNKWITFIGKKQIETKGGVQFVNEYKVNDIWKLNIDYYEGGARKTLPSYKRGCTEGGAQNDYKEEPKKNKNISVSKADSPHHRIFDYFNEEVKKRFGVFPEFNGARDGKLISGRLKKYGEEKVKKIIDYYLDSEKCKKFGFNLSVCLSSDTINKYLQENEAYV